MALDILLLRCLPAFLAAAILSSGSAHAGDKQDKVKSAVHVVGIYEAGPLQNFESILSKPGNIDWFRLSEMIVDQGKKDAPSPGKRVWNLLKKDARDAVQDQERMKRIDAWRRNPQDGPPRNQEDITAFVALSSGLETALRRPDFFDEKDFAGVGLDYDTRLGETLANFAGKICPPSRNRKFSRHLVILEH
jgi:hypothetical protein